MTDPRVTEELKLLADRLRVTVHGSPRQLRDPTRPWVTKEVRKPPTPHEGPSWFLMYIVLCLLPQLAAMLCRSFPSDVSDVLWQMFLHFQ